MAPKARQIAAQECPNCGTSHDVGVYVTGQRVLCACGIHFEVRRTDVSGVGARPPTGPTQPGRRNTGDNVIALAPGVERPPGASLDFGPTAVAGAASPPGSEVEDGVTFISQPAQIAIPGYELLEVLGRGGMGEVWRAKQHSLGRTVAVKILPPRLAKDAEFVARFEKEATALASLSHPNIIQIIDRGVAGEHYFFVMEYVEGRSLREVIGQGRLPPQEALRIVAQISRAIDYAHEKQIIHRDLKPENILVDSRGHAKVADFGLAGIRDTEGKLQLTATSVAMGTVNYMAPEQRRDAKHVDGRADLYSLGVVLYELLTGELPIGRFKLPSERVPGIDPRVDEIVARALESDREARYPRAAMVTAAIEELLGSSAGVPAGALPSQVGMVDTKPGKPSVLPTQPGSVIEKGFNGLKLGLMVVGGLAALAVLLKYLPLSLGEREGVRDPEIKENPLPSPPKYPPNTAGELFSAATYETLPDGRARLRLTFEEGEEELNAHAGSWELEGEALSAVQAGNEVGEGDRLKLIPRAYVAHRYFSTDDVTVEADLQVQGLEGEYTVEQDAQRFAEVAVRIKDLQVSVFAIPDAGMRLMWRYFTPDGLEVIGNSARDLENMVEDETPVPKGKFRVKLVLKRKKNAVDVNGYVNGQRFVHKTLVGLHGQTGKIAVGCRNLRCTFDELVATGLPMARPGPRRGD